MQRPMLSNNTIAPQQWQELNGRDPIFNKCDSVGTWLYGTPIPSGKVECGSSSRGYGPSDARRSVREASRVQFAPHPGSRRDVQGTIPAWGFPCVALKLRRSSLILP